MSAQGPKMARQMERSLQIGHIPLVYLAGHRSAERVWKVEAEAEHQGEQSDALFLHFFFFFFSGTSSRVTVARGFPSVYCGAMGCASLPRDAPQCSWVGGMPCKVQWKMTSQKNCRG